MAALLLFKRFLSTKNSINWGDRGWKDPKFKDLERVFLDEFDYGCRFFILSRQSPAEFLVSIAALAHNCPAPKIFFHGKQEEISRFISRFDCLPCLLVLSSRFSRSPEPLFAPKMNWAARTQDIDTNSIELNSKWKQKEWSRRKILAIEVIRVQLVSLVEVWENIQLKLSKWKQKFHRNSHFSFPRIPIVLIVSSKRRRLMMLIDERMHRGAGKPSKSRVLLKCHRESISCRWQNVLWHVELRQPPQAVWQGSLKV